MSDPRINKWFEAVTAGDIAALGAMLSGGADVDTLNAHGQTALHLAAGHGRCNVVDVLIRAGADVNAVDSEGWTALHYAARHGQGNSVAALLQSGADVDVADNDGWTALHIAAAHGHRPDVEAILIHAGADVNASDCDGWRPLHWAAARGRVNSVEMLIRAGADSAVRDLQGQTPHDRTPPYFAKTFDRVIAQVRSELVQASDRVYAQPPKRPRL